MIVLDAVSAGVQTARPGEGDTRLMFVPMSPLSYLVFGLTFIGLGCWMALFNDPMVVRGLGGCSC